MDIWTALLDVLILLSAAMILGALCERLKQSAIIGYLAAGALLGPHALDWMPNHEAVTAIAELGVTLLLFSIGLEFSWNHLKRFGAIAMNKFGLRWGRKVGLRLYSLDELAEIARRSRFGDHHSLERTTLLNVPIFVRITLNKPGED